uniref:Ubl4 C-terminal TUGS domain-containing protein n=1 Tax=Rhodosorus marinus TaxID=101924 RepID=A0A7S3EQ69_9RHOD|mmetsp:Transcript_9157/g.40171  ORF Transcript_9157/g.40171 Transcript_9157/m.40171 type:complete len:124 (+) Transcript_9157:671-1042(+)|eukprot:CAMPEP_0113965338 /NCGR_PEP_ID=MMETSP0011_2-20120614/7684_1 /TAXON_ID=101924 /ORGANISM="Rhodosorus marinus" /LENGTH=123 /DNA_ID=CAMNT_0000977829 /DNA_START=191 /DNA_END=562 /DNA_ORIENTATION=- /assembly_acc=CAM_ASM_000156
MSFLAQLDEELAKLPVAFDPSYRGPRARGGPMMENNGSTRKVPPTSLNVESSKAGLPDPPKAPEKSEESSASVDYWERVGYILGKHFDEKKANQILRTMMRDQLDWVSSLSLDEIEMLAGKPD